MTELVQISSINTFVDLAKKIPSLANLPSMSSLKNIVNTYQPKKGCGCSGGAKRTTDELSSYRLMFEASMSMLSAEEKKTFKELLNTKKVCYFIKDNKGQIKKYCF